MVKKGLFATILSIALSSTALAATPADVDKMTTYAVVLGRSVACGADIKVPMRRVGIWMDKKFPPGSMDQKKYLPVFMKGVSYNAEEQKQGRSPDSCPAVLEAYRTFPWP